MLNTQSTRLDWDYPVFVYVLGASEPAGTCLVSELPTYTRTLADAGLVWTSTRRVPAEPTLTDLLGWFA